MSLIENWHVVQQNKDNPYAVLQWIRDNNNALLEARSIGTEIGKELTSAVEKELDKVFK